MHYSYQATDSVTGEVHGWTSETPDPTGTSYPGPNSPLAILQTNDPPTGTMTAGRGYAVSDAVGKAAVANVAALRADPDLILAGSTRLDCHTYAGHGGGDLYWDAASTATDDNGVVFAVSGVTTGRWKRRSPTGNIEDWGADPNGVGLSDAALSAAIVWQQLDSQKRRVYIPAGEYLCDDTHALPAWYFKLEGTGQSSRLKFAGGPTKSFFTQFDGAVKFVFRKVAITGDADCGKAIFDLTEGYATWLEFDVDVDVSGEWLYWLHTTDWPGTTSRGAFQWGRFKISNLWRTTHVAQHGIYCEGCYWNGCYVQIDAQNLTGDALHMVALSSYPDGGFAEFTGSVQGCYRALYMSGGANLTFNTMFEEANTVASYIENASGLRFNRYGSDKKLTLVNVSNSKFWAFGGPIDEDAACSNNVFELSANGPADSMTRVNMSQISLTKYSNFGVPGKGAGAGWGYADPPNIFPNGDFSRWIAGATTQNVGGAYYTSYAAVRCGDGCVDTTRTRNAKNCALLKRTAPAQNMTAIWRLTPALDNSFLGCNITVSFKAKGWKATNSCPSVIVAPYTACDGWHNAYGGGVPCENGFTHFVISIEITAAMVSGGIAFSIFGEAATDEQIYLSELQAVIGKYAPRVFSRCGQSPFFDYAIDDNGNMIEYTDAAPTLDVDPHNSQAYQDGDIQIVRTPVTEVTSGGMSFLTYAYRYLGGDWQPLQTITGLVGV